MIASGIRGFSSLLLVTSVHVASEPTIIAERIYSARHWIADSGPRARDRLVSRASPPYAKSVGGAGAR
jgi:hypothetical protein